MTGLLHLVHHPVPVAGGFQSNLARGRQAAQEVDLLLPVVLDPDGGRGLALAVDGHEDRELLVCVASDDCWHGVLLSGASHAFIGSPRMGAAQQPEVAVRELTENTRLMEKRQQKRYPRGERRLLLGNHMSVVCQNL